jgi:MbtH protein
MYARDEGRENPYVVVRSRTGHYSIWPAGLAIPSGWEQVGEPDGREDCLGFIEENWEDPILGARPWPGDG